MKKTLIVLTLLAGALSGAQAGIILSDDFTYNDGPIAQPTAATINPSSTWLANSGATDLDVTNNTLIVTSQRAQDGYHTLTGYPYLTNGPTTALYSRFTLKCTFLPTAPAGTYFASFGGTNQYASGGANVSGFRARLWASQTNYLDGSGVGVGQFRLGIVNSGYDVNNVSLGNTNYVWPTPLLTNTTYTIVTKYVLATGASTLWVNPSAETDPSVTDPTVLPAEPTSAPPVNGILNISGYCFRQVTGEGTLLIDDLRVGTLFSDIAGANTSPTLEANLAAPWNTPRNTALGPITLTVQDAETVASSLNVNGASSNPGLVANNDIVFATVPGTGGTNRTVTITPTAGQQGSTTIYLSVNDSVNFTTNSFLLTVGAPSISTIPNQITSVNTATPAIPFTVTDAEGDTLTVTKASSNPTLVVANDTDIAIGGSGPSRTVTITPESGQTGVAIITLSVSDGHSTVSTSFTLTVSPSLGVIFSEPFNYDNGSLYGASGSPWTHASPTGTNFGQLQVTNGQAQLSRSQAEDVSAPLIGAPYASSSGVVFYTGFQVAFTELPSNLGSYFLHLKDSDTGTTFRAKVFANTSGAATGLFRLGVSSSANTPSPQFGRDLILNQPYIVVTRYNSGTGETRFWVNPTSESSPSVDSTDTSLTSQIGSIGLREDTGIGTNYIDNIVISTSFADVMPTIVRPTLTNQVDNLGNLIVSWNNALFALQSATDVAGPYTDIQGASSPYTNTISGQLFFRARY